MITHLGKETWLAASAVDYSAKGLCLLLSDSLNSGESVYILAAVTPDGKEARDLSVNGVTTYCRPTENGKWKVGLQFLDISEAEMDDWAEFTGCV